MLKDHFMQSMTGTQEVENTETLKLDEFYLDQVNRKLAALEASLEALEAGDRFEEEIKSVLNYCMQIMDLGMIHGYEGVEAIAESMFAAARYCAQHGPGAVEEVRPKLLKALQALRQVVDMTDPSATQALIDRARMEMDYRIDDLLPGEEPEQDDMLAEPVRNRPAPLNLDESVQQDEGAAVESEQSADENVAAPEPPAVETLADALADFSVPEPGSDLVFDKTDAFLHGETILLNGSLSENAIQKIHKLLDQVEDSIEEAETGIDLDDAVQMVQDSCQALREGCRDTGYEVLMEIVEPMQKVAQEYLQSDLIRLEGIEAIRRGNIIIRDFLQQGKLPTAAVAKFRAEVEALEARAAQKLEDDIEWNEINLGEELSISPPPKLPLVVRLKQLFGMY